MPIAPHEVEIIILGSGGSPGVPMPACDCAVCRSEVPENRRTRCSILLSYHGRNLLIDTATDLRQQVLREKINHIDAVLYTHTHADHVHGIDDLRPFNHRQQQLIPLYGSASAMEHLRRVFPYIFDPAIKLGYRPRLETRILEKPEDILGLPVIPIPLRHGDDEATGYRVGPFAYLTDCSEIPAASRGLLRGLDLLILDGLRLRPHPTHFHVAAAVAEARRIGARRTLLTHLNHEIDHHRHESELPPGVGFAYDGQRLTFSLADQEHAP
ncbi:GPMC system MBL fold metallohydrolase [Geothermobacter hydrogeniphilus]|uniref:GPMC system MBL fold metallohydrolase n=1 Tax=Geothermobacter hydrogeniphilus TaxID=1969733 RepID=UPI002481F60D|nr:GPMC system MBL fold metallohydrolase [Geothermobacter hydrogeniphilus]